MVVNDFRLERAEAVAAEVEKLGVKALAAQCDVTSYASVTAMFEKARMMRDQNTRMAETYDQLKEILEKSGGFVAAWFKPNREIEAKIKEQTRATVRFIIQDDATKRGKCIYSGEETDCRVLFGQAY